jgi:hypothetical protein
MTSLARAKEFLARKAAKLALTIVPLAALTTIVPTTAHAGVILGPNNCAATSSSNSGSCTASIVGLPGTNSEFPWVQVFGSILNSSGVFALIDVTGPASGSTVGGDIPISWLFSLSSSGSGTAEWSVSATLLDAEEDLLGYFIASGSAAPFNSSVSGSAAAATQEGLIVHLLVWRRRV